MKLICNRCSKSFSSKQCLKRHSERKYICIGVEKKQTKKSYPKELSKVIQSYPKLSLMSKKKKMLTIIM